MNIVEEIKHRQHGDLIAIKDGDLEVSFQSLLDEVEKITQQIASQDCFQHHALPRIGVKLPNGLSYIIIALAVLESGACFVPIPDELTAKEQQQLIEQTALHAIVSQDSAGNIQLPFDLGNASCKATSTADPDFPESAFNTLGPAFIRFSSGTTAASKGVVISHQSLFERIHAANDGLAIAPGEAVLWTLPMAHHFAVSIILYLYFGATTVLETSHQPEKIYQAAKDSGTHLLYGSPFHFAQLAQCKSAAPLPNLRLAMSTASALSENIARSFEERFQLPLTQALGIIEVGLPVMNLKHASSMPTALGQTLPSYQWQSIPHGEDPHIGELHLKGPGMFDAYLSPWETRTERCDQGWFPTGDLIEMLDGNTLIMRGRSKSVINVAGMKVFPEEIEAILNAHPSVIKSRIYAGEHQTLGAYPIAEFTAKDPEISAQELRKYCSSNLATYKIPMQFRQVESIDLTASGKVKRH